MPLFIFWRSPKKVSAAPRAWKIRLDSKVLVWSGWRKCTRDVVLADARDAATTFHEAQEPRPYRRKAPVIVGASEALAREVAMHLNFGEVSSPQSGIAVFDNAAVTASGVVLSADGRVVRESLIGTENWTTFAAFSRCPDTFKLRITSRALASRLRFKGAPHILLRQAYDSNYGHWLVECLPCIAIIAQYFNLGACRFIVSRSEGTMPEIYRETLALCGIKRDQIDVIGWEHVHVDTLVYPLPITRHPWVKSPAIVEYLEGIATRIATAGRGPSRIYVSRNKGQTRHLRNENRVIDILRRHDFTIVHPETLSFADQVQTFRDAEIVVGNCGAALTNVVFCPRGVVVFALTTQAMQDDFFWDLVDLKDGNYVSLHGTAECEAPSLHSDFTIDISVFEMLLEQCLTKTNDIDV